jgi:hypothetical protein
MNEPPSTPARIRRKDGWTPERIRIFLLALHGGQSITAAAAAAGMSRQSAYAFRASPSGRRFAFAWCLAQEIARRRRVKGVMEEILAAQRRRRRRLVRPRRMVELPAGRDQDDPTGIRSCFR